MGVRAIPARARLGPDITTLRRRYAKSGSRAISLEITPTRFPVFTAAPERVHTLALRTSPKLERGSTEAVVDSIARPVTFILRDRMLRNSLVHAPTATRRRRTHQARKSRSPRSMVTLTGTSCARTQTKSESTQPSERDQRLTYEHSEYASDQAIPDPEIAEATSVFARGNLRRD